MRTLCSSTLIGEFFVIGFAGLVAMKDADLSTSTVWTVCGIAMLISVLLCGMVTRPGGVALGWALQIALVASGFVVPIMFFLGCSSPPCGGRPCTSGARSTRRRRGSPPRPPRPLRIPLTLRDSCPETPCNLIPPHTPAVETLRP